MYTKTGKSKENKSRAAGNSIVKGKNGSTGTFGFVNNRTSFLQKRLQKLTNVNVTQPHNIQRQPCTQLAIIMNGHRYDQLYKTHGFVEAFAKHFHTTPWNISDLISNYIEYAFKNNFSFGSYNELITNVLVGNNHHLPLTPNYVDFNSRNTINMTGSRQQDFNLANQNYINRNRWTWHHIEGITFNNGHWQCDMILVNQIHHRQNHVGAVQQWEQVNGIQYH